jgi:uncharacterized membrane protein
MSRTAIISFVGLGVATLVALQFEGVVARGILTGFAFGSFVSLTAGLWLRHIIQTRPGGAMQGLLEGFGMKIICLLISVLCLRYLDAVGAYADWLAFALAYTASALIGLFSTTWENSRVLINGDGAL